ncbi:MAG TPA: O-antigen ligase family protein [Candidatus Thermoplasmatota archaeon]
MRGVSPAGGPSVAVVDRPWHASADPLLAGGAALGAGVGIVLAVGGAASGGLYMTIAGAALSASGLAVLLAAGWLESLALVALSVPLPALVSTGEVRVAAAAPVAAIVVASWIVRAGTSGRRIESGSLPRGALTLLLVAFLFAAPFAGSLAVALREILNLSVLLALLVVAIDLLGSEVEGRERVVGLLAVVGAVTGGAAVLETIGVIPGEFPRSGTPFNRAALAFGQPNPLALLLALCIPLLVHRRATASNLPARLAWTAALAAGVLGLVGTFSRGAWLALVLGAGALLAARAWRPAVRIWMATLAVALVLDAASGGALRDTAVRTVGDWVVEQRALLLWAGVLMFFDHPLVGVGPGGFATELDVYAPMLPRLFDLKPTPHNAYVQMAAETGVVGLLAFVVFLVAVFRVFRGDLVRAEDPHERSLRAALLWCLGILVVSGFALWPFAHGTGEAVVLILAVGLARDPSRRERVRAARPRAVA